MDGDEHGASPAPAPAAKPARRRNIRRRPADDDDAGDAGDAGGAAVLEDARTLAALRDRRKGLSAEALLAAPRAAAADGADALLDGGAPAASTGGGDTALAATYVKETAADAAAAAAAADAEAYVEAELARRMGLPPPPDRAARGGAADAWRDARDALYAIPDELRGQRAAVGGDADAYGGGAAVVEVALPRGDAVANVERTEAAKRAMLGLPPLHGDGGDGRRREDARSAAAAARAALPRSFGGGKRAKH